MEFTNYEKQLIREILEDVINNASKEPGDTTYNTTDDLLFTFSDEDYKTLKKSLKKIQ